MKTAREVAWKILVDLGVVFNPGDHDALTAAIEARDRELVEACATLLERRAAYEDARAIRALIPKEAP